MGIHLAENIEKICSVREFTGVFTGHRISSYEQLNGITLELSVKTHGFDFYTFYCLLCEH